MVIIPENTSFKKKSDKSKKSIDIIKKNKRNNKNKWKNQINSGEIKK